MKPLALCLVLAASTAFAQDKPAAPGAPAPAAKKERKTSPEAEAALTRYVSLLHFPSGKYKTLEMNSHTDVAMMGGEVGCRFTVKADGVVDVDVTLSEAMKQQIAGGGEGVKKAAAKMVGGVFKPFLVPADVVAKQYDLSSRVDGGKTVVEMKRFSDDAAWETATLWFSADGLLEKQVGTPHVDPNDPMSAMNAGAELETTLEYKKRGDLYTIESAKILQPMGEAGVKFSYYELPGVSPLPRQIDLSDPMIGELAIAVHDIVVDGKKVAGTERKEEPKPAPTPTPGTPPAPAGK
jgi:hypothetical protein